MPHYKSVGGDLVLMEKYLLDEAEKAKKASEVTVAKEQPKEVVTKKAKETLRVKPKRLFKKYGK